MKPAQNHIGRHREPEFDIYRSKPEVPPTKWKKLVSIGKRGVLNHIDKVTDGIWMACTGEKFIEDMPPIGPLFFFTPLPPPASERLVDEEGLDSESPNDSAKTARLLRIKQQSMARE